MNKITRIALAVIIMTTVVSGCGKAAFRPVETGKTVSPFASFRDIPGVTTEEIAAIETLQKEHDTFVYAMTPSTEAFSKGNGEDAVGGYGALFCEWLTGLFDLPFRPEIYAWNDLLDKLNTGELDFAGNMTPTDERRKIYHMTDPIAERQYKTIQLAESLPLERIALTRPPRYVFIEGAAIAANVASVRESDTYEAIFVRDYAEAYQALENGKADAFIGDSAVVSSFDIYGSLYINDFLPLIFSPVSMATANRELEPVISIVTKALRSGAVPYLNYLYNQGYQAYKKYKFSMMLNEEEKEYLENPSPIPMAARYFNYPIDFYNTYENKWEGLTFDVLHEVEDLTGLTFTVVNGKNAPLFELYEMVRVGDAYLVPELLISNERKEHYIWTEHKFITDQYALISKSHLPNVSANEISHMRVGLIRNTVRAGLFHTWFPDAVNVTEYETDEDAMFAVEHGAVDMVMSSKNRMISYLNYYGLLDYKANYLFNHPYEATFGFNKNQTVLCSIMDKAIGVIDTYVITEQWMTRTYDYKIKLLETRLPWLIGATTLSLVVLSLILVLFFRSRIQEKRLIKQQAELEAANHAKSSFLTTMSHEMRTPMNAILGIAEIQLQDEDLSPDMKDALHMIYNSGYSLMRVLNDLLDLSKIEAGKLVLINDRYETVNMISDAINLNVLFIGSKPIQFKLHVDENMPLELIGDDLHIKQVVNNLLSNAFKYTDSGEVRLSFSAQITDGETAPNVTLTIGVSDTGHGMTEAQIQNLFDAYSHFNLKANRLVEGTGLGMNIVQQLVNKMGGNIAVNSTVGGGTEVTVHLIQGYAGPARLGKELAENLIDFRLANILKKKDQILREPMPYGRVLVVDDMETNLYVARGFLLPYGLIVDTALSGMEAIEKVERNNEYDIIFMDHMMPEMDGIEAVQIIRGKGYMHPIVALTANAVSGQAEMFMANGFDGFISKPIDIRELNASLNKFVRDRHTTEEIEAAHAAYGGGAVVDDAVPQSDPGLAKVFARDAEKAIAVLQGYEERNAYGSDDLQAYIINVHALKSALANIGETKLSGFARELEQAGRERNIAFISEETSAFLEGLRAVVDKIKPDAEGYDASDVSDEDMAYLRKMLLTVKEACAAYDKKAAKAALAELKQKPWSSAYNELLDSIAEYLLHSDFDEAEAACAAYLSMDTSYLGREK